MTHEEAETELRKLGMDWWILHPCGEFCIDHSFMPDEWNLLEQAAKIVKEYNMSLVKELPNEFARVHAGEVARGSD